MMRLAGILALAAVGLASTSGLGQERTNDVSLDEFAVDSAGPRLEMEQLNEGAVPISAVEAHSDRSLEIPGPGPATKGNDSAKAAQLSPAGEYSPSPQVSNANASRDVTPDGVSTSEDSRPRPMTKLAGQDRCDPQAGMEQSDSCAEILELRAAEFRATEAPRMSAEQILLAEQGEDPDVLAPRSADIRLRLATLDEPDADRRSNQEIASIFLEAGIPESSTDTLPAGEEANERLAQILEGLEIQVPVSGQP